MRNFVGGFNFKRILGNRADPLAPPSPPEQVYSSPMRMPEPAVEPISEMEQVSGDNLTGVRLVEQPSPPQASVRSQARTIDNGVPPPPHFPPSGSVRSRPLDNYLGSIHQLPQPPRSPGAFNAPSGSVHSRPLGNLIYSDMPQMPHVTSVPASGSIRPRALDENITDPTAGGALYAPEPLYLPPVHNLPAPPSTVGHGMTLEGTTAVGHEPVLRVNPDSPIHASPDLRPASDYAKMDPPPPGSGEISFKSFLSRVGNFFRDLNELPWMAERITADFVPGEPVHRLSHTPSYHSVRKASRPSTWYGAEPFDLTRGMGSPMSQPDIMVESNERRAIYPGGGYVPSQSNYIYSGPPRVQESYRYPYPVTHSQV
ncbi:hypothetical protein BDZ89DRAFT_1086410 [Hymenopellis radicata]|nr:hypothetical protein BDZ89DRAFT_1086410 [Hymenopellis radicata]